MKKTSDVLRLFAVVSIGIGILGDAISFGQDERSKPDSQIQIQQIESGITVYGKKNRFAAIGSATSFDNSPDGRTLAFASGNIKLFDLDENRIIETLGETSDFFRHVRYSPDGLLLFAGGMKTDGLAEVRVYDGISHQPVGTAISSKLPGSDNLDHFTLQSMIISDDATYIGLFSHSSLQVRERESGVLVYRADGLDYVSGACFTPDEQYILFPKNGRVTVVDLDSGVEQDKDTFAVVGKAAYQISANFSTNTLAVPTGNTVTLHQLDRINPHPIEIKLPKNHSADWLSFSDDGKLLAVITRDFQQTTNIIVLDVDSQKIKEIVPVAIGHSINLRFTSDNKTMWLAGSGISGIKEILLGETGDSGDADHPSGPPTQLEIHPSGNALLAATANGEVTSLKLTNG